MVTSGPQAEPERNKLVKRLGVLTKKRGNKDINGKTHKTSQSHDGHVTLETLGRQEQQPQLQRHNSAPQPRQAAPRPQVSEAGDRNIASPSPITTASQDRTANLKRKHDLDRIDELDESNLFGISLHHDGPYEGIKAILGSSSRMPLGYQNDGRLYQYHEKTLKTSGHLYELPKAPDGVPLNLEPGQLLPRNFKREQRKAPRFRNIVSPLPPQSESTAAQPFASEPTIPPRHQNYNQIPFHNNPAKNGRRNRNPAAANDNPLDGPPFDPMSVIGLAMLKEASEDSPPPAAHGNHQREEEEEEEWVEVAGSEVIPVVEPTQIEELEPEFDPYDPKSLEHPSAAHQPTNDDVNDDSFMPLPRLIPMSEDEFHAHGAGAVRNNQFDGLPAGVQTEDLTHLLESPHEDASADSLSPRPRLHAGAGSEETLVQRDEELPVTPAAVPVAEAGVRTDITTAKEDEHAQLHVEDTSPPKLKDLDQERIGEAIQIPISTSQPLTNRVDILPDEVSAKPEVDDVGVASTQIHASRAARYDKQLPPNPPISPDITTFPPAQRPEPTYVPPHLRSGNTESPVDRRPAGVQKPLQRSDTISTRLSSGSYQSYSSNKADDGHSAVVPHSKPAVTALMLLKKKTDPKRQQQMIPPAFPSIPTLMHNFGSETFDRYPQPAQPASKKRPAPSIQDSRSNIIYAARSQSRASVASSSRSQLSPIQEDDKPLGKSRKVNVAPSQSPNRSKSSRVPSHSSNVPSAPYGSHIRVEVGQVYPQHLYPPGTKIQPVAYQVPASLKPATHAPNPQNRTPLMPASQMSSLTFNGGQVPPPTNRSPGSQEMENGSAVSTKPNRQPPAYMPTNRGNGQIPAHPKETTPRSSTESEEERRPLRVVNAVEPTFQAGPDKEDMEAYGGIKSPSPQPNPPFPQPPEQENARQARPPMSRPSVPPSQQQPRYFPDNASSLRPEDSASNRARSITSYAPSSMALRPPPVHRHLPKKLVMPTPLQPQYQNMVQQQAAAGKQLYSGIFRPRPEPVQHPSSAPGVPAPPQSMLASREPSPPNVLLPILSQESKLDSTSAAGRKLKKRNSYIPPVPRPGEIAPSEPLRFEPVILPPEPPRPKPGAKRLSKRRTNL
ncbi:hypothetical protein CC1G_01768 [Coprinopsis cinerea okayama7|uniref:Uncharacterized protein n=1 Tax=Coprinopsis cinerea (strain Okayama-7 / 130 / ATCC MYA-4618 / FGSC 9003) TaxID=240176 RepID=A8N2C8_COPC7|nr:hypothetical protein CC1G_01768 [Coprinopsis cinerea okayama7\|eukprot:XP_001829088.1 hypothetical protein CC1G_01768 [Coprinopsis cinerea okayama7\